MLGIPSWTAIEALLDGIAGAGTKADLMSQITALYDQGYQAAAIAGQVSRALRTKLIESTSALPADQTFELLHQLIAVPPSHNPERFLELVLMQAHTEDIDHAKLSAAD